MTPSDAYYLAENNPSKFKRKKDYYESIIAISSCYSYWYARSVLKGRFELGEKAIATATYDSYEYSDSVLEGRFELGEYSIFNSSLHRYYYIHTYKNNTAFQYKFI